MSWHAVRRRAWMDGRSAHTQINRLGLARSRRPVLSSALGEWPVADLRLVVGGEKLEELVTRLVDLLQLALHPPAWVRGLRRLRRVPLPLAPLERVTELEEMALKQDRLELSGLELLVGEPLLQTG